MAETKETMTKDFVDHSYFYKPYWIVVSLGFILWAAYVCWTGYWGIVHHRVPVIDLGMQAAILWWIRCSRRRCTAWRRTVFTC